MRGLAILTEHGNVILSPRTNRASYRLRSAAEWFKAVFFKDMRLRDARSATWFGGTGVASG